MADGSASEDALRGRARAAVRDGSAASDATRRSRDCASSTRGGLPFQVVEEQSAALVTRRRRFIRDRPEDKPEREHFGFADGRSQPAIAGVDEDPVGDGIYATTTARGRVAQALVGLGVRQPPRRWRLSRTGEFLLGYENEDGETPRDRARRLGPTARSWSTARWPRTSSASTTSSPRRRRSSGWTRASCGPRSSAAGGRHAARELAGRGSADLQQPAALQRLPLRRRSTGSPARSARTCGARTRATGCPAAASGRCATGSSGAGCPTAKAPREGADLHLLQREPRATASSSSSATGSTTARRSGSARIPTSCSRRPGRAHPDADPRPAQRRAEAAARAVRDRARLRVPLRPLTPRL